MMGFKFVGSLMRSITKWLVSGKTAGTPEIFLSFSKDTFSGEFLLFLLDS